jgi:hypothetical protein
MPTSKPKASPARTTLFSAQQHREQAEYFRQFPNPKAQRTAELHETEARLIEKRDRGTYAKQQIAEKLALARQNAEQYAALADNPRMSPAAALAARNLARSYKAAMARFTRGRWPMSLSGKNEKGRPKAALRDRTYLLVLFPNTSDVSAELRQKALHG